MRREPDVDFHAVPDAHLGIHAKLEQWARWVRVRPQGWQVAPMFRQYRSHSWQWESPQPRPTVNIPEALAMEEAVRWLIPAQRDAIRWVYVACDSPVRMARQLGVSKQGLLELITAGRAELLRKGDKRDLQSEKEPC